MVNVRQKGKRGEDIVRTFLNTNTPHVFEYTPGSGSGKIKGDLYIPKYRNTFTIEVKNYAESPLSDKVLTNTTNDIIRWWSKLLTDSRSSNNSPLLFFKYNRSKLFVITHKKPDVVINYLYINAINCYIMLAEEWIKKEEIKWLIL